MLKIFCTLLSILLSTHTNANLCKNDQVKLQVLGSGGPELDDGRNSSGYLIWYQDKARVLIDAGAGTSVEYGRSGAKFEDLDAILLTHLHVDHSADLAAFIKGSYFTSRSVNLPLYGPAANDLMPATSNYLQRLMGDKGAFAYLNGYANKRADADYKVFATDVPLLKGQTFKYSLTKDNASGAAVNLHMTPSSIAKIAQQAQVKQLVLSHFMKRTLNIQKETLGIIRAKYRGPIILASDGLVVSL